MVFHTKSEYELKSLVSCNQTAKIDNQGYRLPIHATLQKASANKKEFEKPCAFYGLKLNFCGF